MTRAETPRPAWIPALRRMALSLAFASAALGAACSNSSRGLGTEETASYPPTELPPICPCATSVDGGPPTFLDGAPDGCNPDAAIPCMLSTPTGQ